MVNFRRWFRHFFISPWALRRAFPQSTLDVIEGAIGKSETRHTGEIRFAVETALAAPAIWRGMTGRERALEVFSHLRIWDTEHNSGILIYLLLADHDIEIVADRGIAARVDAAAWETIARAMEAAFRQGEFERGAVTGIEQINALLITHFPPTGNNPNELPNRPVMI